MPSTDWKEIVGPGEEARFERLGAQLRDLQRTRAGKGKGDRALHAKAHGGVEADLRVLPDLPEHLRHGLFASPGTYRTYVRFSNGSGARGGDGKPDVRGVALKVTGVAGKKVIPGMEDAPTQDFLLIHARTIPFRSPEEFVGFVLATRSPALALPRLALRFGPFGAVGLLRRVLGGFAAGAPSIATQTYHGPAPIQLGPYAARLTLAPVDPPVVGPVAAMPAGHYAADLARRLREGPLAYDLQAQLYVDPARTPLEDSSVPWRDEDAPLETVARLHLTAQDVGSPRGARVAAFVEKLSFDPWHALEAHRPLGAIMRARSPAYRLSTGERGAAGEPDGSERFD